MQSVREGEGRGGRCSSLPRLTFSIRQQNDIFEGGKKERENLVFLLGPLAGGEMQLWKPTLSVMDDALLGLNFLSQQLVIHGAQFINS